MKSVKFGRAQLELNEEEYKAYLIGTFFGRVEGVAFGAVLSAAIAVLVSIL